MKNQLLSAQEQDARYNICKLCPNYMGMTKMCMKCGCFLPLKVKWKLALCPEHKWPGEEHLRT